MRGMENDMNLTELIADVTYGRQRDWPYAKSQEVEIFLHELKVAADVMLSNCDANNTDAEKLRKLIQ